MAGIVALLTERPELCARYQRAYTHVLVDEFQDTNAAQYRLIHQLIGQEVCSSFSTQDADMYSWCVTKCGLDIQVSCASMRQLDCRAIQAATDRRNGTRIITDPMQHEPHQLTRNVHPHHQISYCCLQHDNKYSSWSCCATAVKANMMNCPSATCREICLWWATPIRPSMDGVVPKPTTCRPCSTMTSQV